MPNTARETAVISGKAFWAKLHEKDLLTEKYQIDICQLSEVYKDKLTSHGVIIKNKNDDRGDFVTARTKYPNIPIIDTSKNPVSNKTLIGNGSDVKVKIAFNKKHQNIEKTGTALWLNKVQLVNLIEYTRKDTDFDDDDELA